LTQYDETLQPERRPSKDEDLSFWALGFYSFAAGMMAILGIFHLLNGLTAIVDGSFYTVRPNFALEMGTTTWGWIHVVSGILLLAGSLGLLFGARWARAIGVVFAFISIIWNFYSIPYYPIWSVLMVVMAIGVIWALTTHGAEFAIEDDVEES
jgi:hypothetical protein